MPSIHLKARNRAVALILVALVIILYVMAFVRVQAQPWSHALKKHGIEAAKTISENAHTKGQKAHSVSAS